MSWKPWSRKKYRTFSVNLEKNEIQIQKVFHATDGAPMHYLAVYHMANTKKLQKLATAEELVVLRLFKTHYIYGKGKREEGAGSHPVKSNDPGHGVSTGFL